MSEEEKTIIELDIEAKYVDQTEKEFLSRLTYAECVYILTPENEYCDKVINLSLLKLREIIEIQQNRIQELEKINTEHQKLNGELREEIKQLKHKIQKIMDYVDNL